MLESTRRQFLASAAAVPAAVQDRAVERSIPRRHLIASRLSEAKLAALLVPRSEWKPFPTLSDRAGWEALPATTRAALTEEG